MIRDLLGQVRTIRIDQINLGNRGREDYGDIRELSQSISQRGLIHPIAVHSLTGEPPYTLLAGGRRLKACQENKMVAISARIYTDELTEHDMRAIELFENLHRKGLTHDEEVKMTAALHETLLAINGAKTQRSAGAPGHSMRDTARLLGKSIGKVSQDIKLAKAITKFPELGLQHAKNKHTATRQLDRLENAIRNALIAEAAKLDPEPGVAGNDPTQQLISAYREGNFWENKLPDSSFQFIECDPPYQIDLARYRKADDKHQLRGEYEHVPVGDYEAFLTRLARECWRLGAPDSWVLLWCVSESHTHIYKAFSSVGYAVNPVYGIWKKGANPGQSHSPQTVLSNSYEPFMYARKGDPRLYRMGHTNIFDYTGVHETRRYHPTQKPLELYKEILGTFCWPGHNILSPFAGSGTTILAAFDIGLSAIGYDTSLEFRNAYIARVMREYSQQELFPVGGK